MCEYFSTKNALQDQLIEYFSDWALNFGYIQTVINFPLTVLGSLNPLAAHIYRLHWQLWTGTKFPDLSVNVHATMIMLLWSRCRVSLLGCRLFRSRLLCKMVVLNGKNNCTGFCGVCFTISCFVSLWLCATSMALATRANAFPKGVARRCLYVCVCGLSLNILVCTAQDATAVLI